MKKAEQTTEMVSFLRAIRFDPADETNRLVFADWLEERGDWRAEFLRLDCLLASETEPSEKKSKLKARWQALWERLTPSWQSVLARSAIENCRPALPEDNFQLRFEFQCPQKWENLKPTVEDDIRFCHSCEKSVYYCTYLHDAREHAKTGHCVAVSIGIPRTVGDLVRKIDHPPRPPMTVLGGLHIETAEEV